MTDDLSPTARALRFDRDHARRLRALAYRMLGSRAEAEDIVQEAWLRWAEVDISAVQHEGAFLSRLVTNLCLDKLRSAAVQREHYVGVWLPEPMLEDEALFGWAPGPEKQAEFAQDVSIAFMLALERLSPLERAAFLLHDVFDLDYDEIARHLDRSEAACRQLISRARKNIKADYARHEVAKEEADRLVHAFMDAVRSQDVSALAQLLSEDAVMMADGGGKVAAVPKPLHGGAQIARTFIGFAQLPTSASWRLVPAVVNGLPGLLILDDSNGGRLVQTIALAPSAEPGQVGAVYIQRNPDKLGGIRMRVTNAAADPS
ncbi:RNA polymerase sigma-70 factor (ECF subfamily) [Pelomonas saccharophila]|uniref:RNA polymerase sigma-70 factor (ECF subfamily) n=1 Tax=Roseateles saccharophilus TaxID=304 RepID=A0ABU1YU37_ROSSA|nr:RNA polymerase sigma factor SigJ [Roseateles saccharophilus]MDR7272374.1 RNA polymerase sigma-70 factor (ECF subfamily) [Roseateles saccharophilus]